MPWSETTLMNQKLPRGASCCSWAAAFLTCCALLIARQLVRPFQYRGHPWNQDRVGGRVGEPAVFMMLRHT